MPIVVCTSVILTLGGSQEDFQFKIQKEFKTSLEYIPIHSLKNPTREKRHKKVSRPFFPPTEHLKHCAAGLPNQLCGVPPGRPRQ